MDLVGTGTGHIRCAVRLGEADTGTQLTSACYSAEGQPLAWYCPHSRRVFTPHFKFFWIQSHRHTQRYVSMATPHPVKLVMKVNQRHSDQGLKQNKKTKTQKQIREKKKTNETVKNSACRIDEGWLPRISRKCRIQNEIQRS